MNKVLLLITAILVSVVPAFAQTPAKEEPAHKMLEFHMALLRRGPKWETTHTKGTGVPASGPISEHGRYAISLLESGKAVIAGPFQEEGDILGVYILRASSADEAKSWVDADPAVKGGHMIAEMLPWWSEDVMKKPKTPIKMTTAYLGFLRRGPKWTPERTAATAEIQKGHMANIQRLADMKKLVVAGPFGGNGDMRGIFVFKVASLQEAKVLAETDPAVQAGRLAIDMHTWLVPEGVLP